MLQILKTLPQLITGDGFSNTEKKNVEEKFIMGSEYLFPNYKNEGNLSACLCFCLLENAIISRNRELIDKFREKINSEWLSLLKDKGLSQRLEKMKKLLTQISENIYFTDLSKNSQLLKDLHKMRCSLKSEFPDILREFICYLVAAIEGKEDENALKGLITKGLTPKDYEILFKEMRINVGLKYFDSKAENSLSDVKFPAFKKKTAYIWLFSLDKYNSKILYTRENFFSLMSETAENARNHERTISYKVYDYLLSRIKFINEIDFKLASSEYFNKDDDVFQRLGDFISENYNNKEAFLRNIKGLEKTFKSIIQNAVSAYGEPAPVNSKKLNNAPHPPIKTGTPKQNRADNKIENSRNQKMEEEAHLKLFYAYFNSIKSDEKKSQDPKLIRDSELMNNNISNYEINDVSREVGESQVAENDEEVWEEEKLICKDLFKEFKKSEEVPTREDFETKREEYISETVLLNKLTNEDEKNKEEGACIQKGLMEAKSKEKFLETEHSNFPNDNGLSNIEDSIIREGFPEIKDEPVKIPNPMSLLKKSFSDISPDQTIESSKYDLTRDLNSDIKEQNEYPLQNNFFKGRLFLLDTSNVSCKSNISFNCSDICNICGQGSNLQSEMFLLSLCRHSYCENCLSSYISKALFDLKPNTKIKCPKENCSEIIQDFLLLYIVEKYAKENKFKLNQFFCKFCPPGSSLLNIDKERSLAQCLKCNFTSLPVEFTFPNETANIIDNLLDIKNLQIGICPYCYKINYTDLDVSQERKNFCKCSSCENLFCYYCSASKYHIDLYGNNFHRKECNSFQKHVGEDFMGFLTICKECDNPHYKCLPPQDASIFFWPFLTEGQIEKIGKVNFFS